jgi:hypothetical protein
MVRIIDYFNVESGLFFLFHQLGKAMDMKGTAYTLKQSIP